MHPVQYETIGRTRFAFIRQGAGYPLLLLHGFPQMHMAWTEVAGGLARHFTLIIPDLPGYGHSTGPTADEQHDAYSKRSMAGSLVRLMEHLGFHRFFVAGHDRGGRVAYRMALDHPEKVTRLAVRHLAEMGDTSDR